MGNRWRIADGKGSVLSKDYEMIVFVPDVKYRVLTGVARTAKEGENVSGDNYSFLRLSNGKVIVTITDGMGSGKLAYDESETVIEMIEQLVEAGFREEMALRLVNSTLIFSQKTDIFSTVDLCVIDLNSGICECIKCGAAATYIRKKNSVRIVSNDTMPIGILPEASPSGTSHRLGDGDLIIMLSDGVTDSFPGEDKEQLIKSIIEESSTDNPQELADYILNRALEINMCKATDDMSVLVAGLWNKY